MVLSLELHRLNGERHDVALVFPDEVAALTLKSFATQVRSKATDVVDVWRCPEIALAAGVCPDAFVSGDSEGAAKITRAMFEHREGPGVVAIADEQRLSTEAADQRFTRIRALVDRVLGPG